MTPPSETAPSNFQVETIYDQGEFLRGIDISNNSEELFVVDNGRKVIIKIIVVNNNK
mgnify:CR=1 FL=1